MAVALDAARWRGRFAAGPNALEASESAVAELVAFWRETVSHWPPGRREAWLNTPDALIALGSRRVKDLLGGIRHLRIHVMERAASMASVVEWESTGRLPPSFDASHQGLGLNWRGVWRYGAVYEPRDAVSYRDERYFAVHVTRSEAPGVSSDVWTATQARQYSARQVLSRGGVAFGDGPRTPRWTPPQAVEVEDLLDTMSGRQAEFYVFPASPSAVAIQRIGEMRGHEI